MKVSYANMKLKVNTSVKTFDFCGQKVEVLQYLPAQDKYDLLMITLQKSLEDNIYNEFKLNLYFELHLVYMYTNISFTEKQKEDITKIYDLFENNGIFSQVISAMPADEYQLLYDWTQETIDAFYKYRNSAVGIMEQISNDYSNFDFDAQKIQKEIGDPENLALLKNVMTKLG